jgi:hypothetical protein
VRCVLGKIEVCLDWAKECAHQGMGGILIGVRDVERDKCVGETAGGVRCDLEMRW